ncbi:MAG TPA: hypothetical protein VHY76_01555, partial [Acetobacteraceae bacterium]|nr:hypothetical protein [Acetobacteraceae bacterium]
MTTTIDVSTEAQLNQAIATVDGETAGDYVIQFATTIAEGTDSGGTAVFQGTTVDLPQDLFALNLVAGVSLTIDGAGNTLDGSNAFRGFLAYAGDITIENLTITDADAVGGAGAFGGGGGAGLGGGLFVAGTTQG